MRMQIHKRDRIKTHTSITNEDEGVVVVVRQFPIILRRPLLFGLVIVLFAIIPWSIGYGTDARWVDISYVWMIACLVLLFAYWLRSWVGWHYSVYILTDQRLMVVKQNGFFTRKVADLALHNIQNVNYSIKGLQGALFGFGELDVETLSGGGSMRLEYIYKPARLQKQIMTEVHRVAKSTSLD